MSTFIFDGTKWLNDINTLNCKDWKMLLCINNEANLHKLLLTNLTNGRIVFRYSCVHYQFINGLWKCTLCWNMYILWKNMYIYALYNIIYHKYPCVYPIQTPIKVQTYTNTYVLCTYLCRYMLYALYTWYLYNVECKYLYIANKYVPIYILYTNIHVHILYC